MRDVTTFDKYEASDVTGTHTATVAMQERKFRKRMDADGEVGGVREARLSDFLDASLQSQQAVRRAMRGTVQ